MIQCGGMEKTAKKHEYQLFIDYIIETHKLNGDNDEYKKKEFVCHLDVDEILSGLKKEYKNKEQLIKEGIKHNILRHNHISNKDKSYVSMPNRESLIMNPKVPQNRSNITNNLLSLFI